MNIRIVSGALLSFLYNHFVGRIPSRSIRKTYLSIWLARIGELSGIQINCRFLNGRKIRIGNRCVINFGSLLDGRKFTISIGDDVSIGPEASILTLGHDPQSPEFADRGGDVVIGDRAWIAYRVIVLPGVTIGEGAVVAAGAVVTKDVDPYTIVAGNPARVIGKRSRDLTYQLNYRPWLL